MNPLLFKKWIILNFLYISLNELYTLEEGCNWT